MTQLRLGMAADADRWIRPLRPDLPGHSSVYQSANRYAHLYWLRDKGIDAWLVHVLFCDDPTYGVRVERSGKWHFWKLKRTWG
jgi:hypothetical protein